MAFNLLVILGPTASGKTKVAIEIAKVLNGEIISADSRQVYRGMDIGTGKDLGEYGTVPYHLIDIVDPGYEFNVFEYQKRFFEVFEKIQERNRLPIMVGGTGMYIEAVIKGYPLVEVPLNPDLRQELARLSMEELASRLFRLNPRLHNSTDLLDRQRLIRAIEIAEGRIQKPPSDSIASALHPIIFGLRWPRAILRRRITERLRRRLNEGLIQEVKELIYKGVSYETLYSYGLEYRYVAAYLQGKLNRNDLFQKLNSAINQLAKRQETWFGRMERQGIGIHWVTGGEEAVGTILERIRKEVSP